MTTLDYARRYVAAGLSVIPIATDGTKRPDGRLLPLVWSQQHEARLPSWNPYRTRIPTDEELARWFRPDRPAGIAVVAGQLSSLECIDFDDGSLLAPWSDLVTAEDPGLCQRLTLHATPRTPSGYHCWFCCPDHPPDGNQKLAQDPSRKEALPRSGGCVLAPCLIETRGEGGYAIVPGSPSGTHETGRDWSHFGGPPLWDPEPIGVEQRDLLLRCARYFDRTPQRQQPIGQTNPDTLRPGEDYDRRGPDWAEILCPHGWQCVYEHGRERRWLRPGKEKGWSATTGVCISAVDGVELLKVFTSNAPPFSEGGVYGRFRARALLWHAGDFSACAGLLAGQGYGAPPVRTQAEPTASEVERVLRALELADPARLRAILDRLRPPTAP